jgi:methionyl-tRNA synthetase
LPYYVTTPIYYVNAEPHLGHAYSTIAADVLARHMRQRGEDVFFLTGTDEHGEPVAQAAEREGTAPQELADRNAERFRALMPTIDVSNDFFIRTTDPEHVARVREIAQTVYDNGYVYEGTYEGWYCPRCADFKTEAELGPGNSCPIHEIPLVREQEDNWFFRLSAFEGDLRRLYAERHDFVLPAFRRNEALAFIESGLQDVSLSRPKLGWGVPLPWDEGQVMYVWFDALLNYVTALSYARPGEDLTDRFWPANLHVIGKDILKFHAVYWPAFLLAADMEPPRRMFIHGYLLMGERKMSKSLGNVLDPFEAIDRFGSDALRFYCFREVSFGQDGSVSAAGFEARYETELANDWGNLASRTLAMIERYRDAVVPEAGVDGELAGGAGGLGGIDREVCELLDRAELTQALEAIWARVRRLNRYVEENRPWDLAKAEAAETPSPATPGRPRTNPGKPGSSVASGSLGAGDRLDGVLYNLAEGVRVLALLLYPYIPRSSDHLLSALGEDDRTLSAFGSRGGGQRLESIAPLFPKLAPA